MAKSKHLLVLIAFILFSWQLTAGPIVHAYTFSDNDEDIQGRLTQIIQDKHGFVWISTFNGLIKYDGYRFQKYKSVSGKYEELASNRINGIWENANGDIWCLTSDEIYLFNVKEDRFINVQSALNKLTSSQVKVWSVYCLDNGVTWMVGYDGECFRMQDNDPLSTCELIPYESSNFLDISKIIVDERGEEWVFGRIGLYRYGQNEKTSRLNFVTSELFDEGIWFVNSLGKMAFYRYDDASLTFHDLPEDNLRFHLSLPQDDSTMLICTTKGVFKLNVNNMQSDIICSENWQNVYVDRQGNYWGVHDDQSIVCLTSDGQRKVYARPKDHVYNSYRVHFEEDEYGLLWLLFADTNDLLYVDADTESLVRPPFERSLQEVRNVSFHKDNQGNFWYAHEHELEYITLQNSPFESVPALLNDEVRAIMQDSDGRYWVSYRKQKLAVYSADGLYLGNLGMDGALHQDKEYSLGATVYHFKQDRQGRIWMATRAHGLLLLEGNKLTQYVHDEKDPYSLSESAIYAVEEDDEGRIWVGTFGGGLNLYQNGKFIHYFNHLGKDQARPNIIRCMKYLGDGQLMIGAREGLFIMSTRFDKVENIHFYHYHKALNRPDGLPDNEIMSILQTRQGDIYLSTNSGGISRILPRDNYLTHDLSFENIAKQQGLGSDIAYSVVEDSQANLWVVSPGNLSCIEKGTEDIMVYDDAYFLETPVFSESFPLVQGDYLLFGTDQGLLRVNSSALVKDDYCPPLNLNDCYINNENAYLRLWQEGGLKLSSKERNLRVSFSAIDFQDKGHLKYAYLLEGVDKDWNETTATTLTYTNLPPGKHLLRIKSTNRYGLWMGNEILLPVSVKPKFFESIWGMLSILLVIVLVMILSVQFFSKMYHLRHRLSVEQELSDAKLKFFTDVSHELRTPLSLIDGPVSEVLEDKQLSDQSRYYLEVVQKNVRRMLNLVNQILDFRKVQSQKMRYCVEQIDVRESLQSLMENFAEMARQHRIEFSLQSTCSEHLLWVDRDKFEKIFFNLLSNAFKYTPEDKSIHILLSEDFDTLMVTVQDTGVGIKKEDVDRLFKPYETVMSQNVFKASSGIGLSLVKQFVDGHHAQIQVLSKPGEGSLFRVIFQKGKEHFLGDEQVEFYIADMSSQASEFNTPVSDIEPVSSPEELPKLLIVEDNDELRDFMQRILATDYNIACAVNGKEGLQKAKELWPDLIITDIMMPVMDGLEMLKHIKQDPDIYQIPVIVLTANSDMDDRIGAVQMGVDDYVMKPFSANYLKARAAALIKHRQELNRRLLDVLTQGNNPIGTCQLQPNMPEIKPADEIFLQEVMAFMEKNMEDASFTIEDFASALNLGRTAFYNKIKATTGLSPVDFVQEIRIKRAVQLLETKNFAVSEVAYKTGFNDPKYFSRCFKKIKGVSPSLYLKQINEG